VFSVPCGFGKRLQIGTCGATEQRTHATRFAANFCTSFTQQDAGHAGWHGTLSLLTLFQPFFILRARLQRFVIGIL